jgi:hypothetical protein
MAPKMYVSEMARNIHIKSHSFNENNTKVWESLCGVFCEGRGEIRHDTAEEGSLPTSRKWLKERPEIESRTTGIPMSHYFSRPGKWVIQLRMLLNGGHKLSQHIKDFISGRGRGKTHTQNFSPK